MIAVSAITLTVFETQVVGFTFHEAQHAAQHAAQHSSQRKAAVPVVDFGDCGICLGQHHFNGTPVSLGSRDFELVSLGQVPSLPEAPWISSFFSPLAARAPPAFLSRYSNRDSA